MWKQLYFIKPHNSIGWVGARGLQHSRNYAKVGVVRRCGQNTVIPNLQESVPLSVLAHAATSFY